MRGRRLFHNEEYFIMKVSPRIVKIIKPSRMRWTEHIDHMKDKRNALEMFVRKA